MFPCGFEPCFLLEEGVGDGQGVFCAQFEEQPPVVVAVADSMPPKHSWPNGVVSAYPCIEVSQHGGYPNMEKSPTSRASKGGF